MTTRTLQTVAVARRRRRSGGFNVRRLFINGEAGGVYDPSDLTAEKVAWRRNLLTWSEDFTNAAWLKANSFITANATVAPDGTVTADEVYETPAAGVAHRIQATITNNVGPLTVSWYAKQNTRTIVQLFTTVGSNTFANFDLASGTIGTVGSDCTAAIQPADFGWYRISISLNATSTSTTVYFALALSATDSRNPAYNGDGTSGAFAWGAQAEQSPTATAYQRITDFTSDFLAAFPTHGLYQDSAGTTPVTALGQPVGLVIDSKTGGLANVGATVLTNGDFASGASWTAGTGWSIGSGVATKTAGTASVLSQAVTLTIPGTYRLIYTMTRSAGTLTPRITGGTTVNATARSASGTYTEYVTTVTGNTTFEFSADASFAGTVDDVTLRLVPGVHAIQPTSSSRPLLDGRVNLLTFSEQFDNAAWTKGAGATIVANAAVAPDGTTTADKLRSGTVTGEYRVTQAIALTSGAPVVFSGYAKRDEWRYAFVYGTGTAVPSATGIVDLDTGAVAVAPSSGTLAVTAVGNGWYRIQWTFTPVASASDSVRFGASNLSNNPTTTGDGTSGIFIWGADLRLAADAAYPYQRVAAATDYADVGVPRAFAFDGFDDSLYTASNMDLSGTDKVTVLAGVRKLSDAAIGLLAETSATSTTNNGAFAMFAPQSASLSGFLWRSRGTSTAEAYALSLPAPTTRVLTGLGNIAVDSCIVRVDGVQTDASAADQGTGNYGNYVLFIGRRNNATLPFNGKAYQLIVRGALTDDATLAQAERYVGAKTGLFL